MLRLKLRQLRGSVECELPFPSPTQSIQLIPLNDLSFVYVKILDQMFIFYLKAEIKYELTAFSQKLSKRSNSSLLLLGCFERILSSHMGV